MKILSWDVGIYNLSYCVLESIENKIDILDWDIINLIDNEEMKKNRTLIFENIPRKLYEKSNLLDVDIVVIENQPSLKNPQMKSIQMILYSYFLILGKIIGNSEKNSSYIEKIDFCSASNKLKIYDGPKIILPEKNTKRKKNVDTVDNNVTDTIVNSVDNTVDNSVVNTVDNTVDNQSITKNKKVTIKYADKKRLAIEHAKYFLKEFPKYIDFFENHKKKDDLADSFLQGLYYIKNIKK